MPKSLCEILLYYFTDVASCVEITVPQEYSVLQKVCQWPSMPNLCILGFIPQVPLLNTGHTNYTVNVHHSIQFLLSHRILHIFVREDCILPICTEGYMYVRSRFISIYNSACSRQDAFARIFVNVLPLYTIYFLSFIISSSDPSEEYGIMSC